MNEMWEWGKKQRHNLGSNVEDREEVPPNTLQNENEKTHKPSVQRGLLSTLSIHQQKQFSTTCHPMSFFSQKKPYIIPIIQSTKPSVSFGCRVSLVLITITTSMGALPAQCPKLLHSIKVIHS